MPRKVKDYDLEPLTEQQSEEQQITEESPAEVETNGPETKNGIIVKSLHVKVRREPSYESEVMELLRRGDRVIIHGKVGEFYKISTSTNKFVYIAAAYVKEG